MKILTYLSQILSLLKISITNGFLRSSTSQDHKLFGLCLCQFVLTNLHRVDTEPH